MGKVYKDIGETKDAIVYLEEGTDEIGCLMNFRGNPNYILVRTDIYDRIISADAENMVTITREEYRSLKKALNIIRDKSVHQVDKAKTDENGYMLLKMRTKLIEGSKCVLYTYRTPYSTKMPISSVLEVIKQDLVSFYGFYDRFEFRGEPTAYGTVDTCVLETKDFLKIIKEREEDRNSGYYLKAGELGRKIYQYIESRERIGFDIDELTPNYKEGLYEITYIAVNWC